MEKSYSHKTWEPIDFTIYFSFIKWWVVLALVLEIVFRFWASGLNAGLFFEQLEIFAWIIRIIFFTILGWRVIINFSYSAPIALIAGACSGGFIGLVIAVLRFFSGLAVWKFANIITETTLAAIVGSLVLFLMAYVFNLRDNK